MKEKKKWYDTWWGALWVLTIIDGSPGRSLRAFMEVDQALSDLEMEEERVVFSSLPANTHNGDNSCSAGSSAYCEN